MTPEERFHNIENFLANFSERLDEQRIRHDERLEAQRIRHDKEIAEIRELQNAFAVGMIRLQSERIQTEEETRQSKRKHDEEMSKLREAQQITEEKLNALIDTVDRIIRNRNLGSDS